MTNEQNSSFRKAFYHLKLSLEYFLDFQRSYVDSIGAKTCKRYSDKIQWCLNDFKSSPDFPSDTLDDFYKEMEDDPFTLNEIGRMAEALPPHQKSSLEKVLQLLIKGEEVTIVLNKEPEPNY